ncbi:muscular LMNA-interacting protein isoform X2 [Mixophyes fleayi]|uniref:muscular LMNA-interacting protein isoform X2 n=1 Tax=Mixophyes fleayi TaxID=3061075 RepID=UPI003F4E2F7A
MDLGKHKTETLSSKTVREDITGSLIEDGVGLLKFTFVPETGRLPSQVLLGKDSTYLPKIVVDHKGAMPQKPEESIENISEKSMHESSENVLNTYHRPRSEDRFSRKKVPSNDPEAIKNDDLFIAEFVVVMDSDDSEEEITIEKTLPLEDKGNQQSTTVQPKAKLGDVNANEMYVPESQQEFCHDVDDQKLQRLRSVPTVDLESYKLQFTNPSCPANGIIGYKGHIMNYMPTTATDTFHTHLPSQKSNSFNISSAESPGSKYLTKYLNSLNNLESPNQCTPSISKSVRSNALSPLPIQVIKYPLCRSPSPLNSPCYGSSSTICSMNICTSPVPRPESASPVSSRLSFLTSLLKSKISITERVPSLDPNHYRLEPNPMPRTEFFKKSALTSNPPRKSFSCFSLNYPRESKIPQFQKKGEIHTSSSDSSILHGESAFYQKPLKTLSTDSMHFKSSSGTLLSRKGAVSPYSQLYRRSITPPYFARENISLLNDKPPLNRHIYSPLKKDCVLGKSRKVTLFPPPLHFNPSYVRQKENVIQHLKSYTPSRGNVKSTCYVTRESSNQKHAKSNSSADIQQNHVFHKPYSNISYRENMDSEMDIFPPLNPSYSCHSYSNEELLRTHTPTLTFTNTSAPSRSLLSRSCELRTTSSLAQSSDHENKKPYKIKSSYKAFAAIPTNTLLLDQKAIDEPEINATNTAMEDTMETHTEMCSPALLRQQTEEICAAIDEHCNSASAARSSEKKCGTKSSNTPRPLSKSTGRETKYASVQPLMNTKTKDLQTKPGVIRPTTLKVNTIENKEERFYSNPFQQFSMPPHKRETDFDESTRGKRKAIWTLSILLHCHLVFPSLSMDMKLYYKLYLIVTYVVKFF